MHSSRLIAVLAALLMAALAVPLSAHGGQYRGPFPNPGGPGGPGTGGPKLDGVNTGVSGGGGQASWQHWWEYNKDPYLRLKERIHSPETEQQGIAIDSMAPTESQRLELVLPALLQLAEEYPNGDVQTACMVAMAKIGAIHNEIDPLELFRDNLTRGHQEVRETAALAMGISGLPEALDDLLFLLNDEPAGRRLVDRNTVDHRTRAFAAYGVGLIAQRSAELQIKQRVFDNLAALLARDEIDSRDLGVALVQAIGLLRPDDAGPGGKRLRWQCLQSLEAFWNREMSKGDEVIQAHVPTSIARLLGRGDSSDHRRIQTEWIEELSDRDRQDVVHQSIILALGAIRLPDAEAGKDDPVSKALKRYHKRGKDQLARFFTLIALAQIGGEQNREFLLERFARGQKATERPWAALALGIYARGEIDQGGEVDDTIGHVLHRGLRDVANPEHRSATAVALGLADYDHAAKDMRKLLADNQRNEVVAGYLCIGLALLEDSESMDELRKTIRGSANQPLLLSQAAVALALLGSQDASDDLLEMIKVGGTSLLKLSALARAFRYVGDRRAAEPLTELMFQNGLTKISRAFVAAALGGIADKDKLPWNSSISVGINYRARVDTLTNGQSGVLDIL